MSSICLSTCSVGVPEKRQTNPGWHRRHIYGLLCDTPRYEILPVTVTILNIPLGCFRPRIRGVPATSYTKDMGQLLQHFASEREMQAFCKHKSDKSFITALLYSEYNERFNVHHIVTFSINVQKQFSILYIFYKYREHKLSKDRSH